VIKLLKSFYEASDDIEHRIDICTKLTMRWFDEDPSVKELAVKTLEELWFHDPFVPGPKRERSKGEATSTVAVIMGVLAGFRERQLPLEDILHKMMLEKQESDITSLRSRYVEICDALIDGLVDASDVPGFVSLLQTFSAEGPLNHRRQRPTAYGQSICSHPHILSC
jgi:cohesin loading factor subunit SCC2